MLKNSFSLLETLFAIVILSILAISIAKISFSSSDVATNNQKLDKIYNKFLQNNITSSQTKTLGDDSIKINVQKQIYQEDGILFYRYKLL